MPERDWAKDWELCQRATLGPWRAEVYAQRVMPYICEHVNSADAHFIAEAREALPYWLQRVRELEADIAWLMQEYGESEEPMSQDALELKERCLILKERDELRKEKDELLQRIREYEKTIRESKEHVRKLMDENERLKVTKELREQGFPVTVQTLRDVTWDDLAKLEIENMRLKDKIKELRAEILALRKLKKGGQAMKPDYSDILDRLGPPLWWDEHGVPRYEPFDPYLCEPCSKAVALMEVECQMCGERFRVAVSANDLALFNWSKYHPNEDYHPTPQDARLFAYGDSPRHGYYGACLAGNTMSSIPIRILKFWEYNKQTFNWERKKEYEIEFIQEEADNDWQNI
ncbi:MAG: hypothetical protein ACPLTR_09605 [Thermacetogeniaceae bacterium]